MKTLYINQPAGLGDIIFSMTAVRRMAADYSKCYWPVQEPHWVEGLQRAYPDIRFIERSQTTLDHDRKDTYKLYRPDHGDITVIPLRFSDSICKVPFKDCMKSKYMFFNLDWKDWMQDAKIARDTNNENALYSKLRGGALHKKFKLVNRIYKTDQSGKAGNVPYFSDAIEMQTLPGFSLFDWAKLILNAEEIHTVGTSLVYLIELLKPTCKVFVYPRHPQHHDHSRYEYILRSCDYTLVK